MGEEVWGFGNEEFEGGGKEDVMDGFGVRVVFVMQRLENLPNGAEEFWYGLDRVSPLINIMEIDLLLNG